MGDQAKTAEGGKVVFTSEAQVTDLAGLWFLITFGFIGGLTMIILGFAIPQLVGPWWLWILSLVPFVLLARWEMRRSKVEIKLFDDGSGGVRLVIGGRAAAIDTAIEPRYERWATAENIPIRHGGGVMMHFSVVVRGNRGRRIAFTQMGGRDAAGWPERKPRLGNGQDVFSTLNIFGLEKALRARGSAD